MLDALRHNPLPALTAAEFLILSPLVGGAELTFGELRSATNWRRSGRTSFLYHVQKLETAGFVDRRRVQGVHPDRRRVETYRVLTATKAGRDAWLEFVDFVTFTARQVENAGAGKVEVLRREADENQKQRPPGDGERSQLLAAAHAELGRFCRVLWGLGEAVTVRRLVAADVGDFDATAGTLRLGKRRVRVDADAAAAIREAIGFHNDGPLLVNRFGRRWTESTVGRSFAKLRRRLKLPLAVKLRGQNWSAGSRRPSRRQMLRRSSRGDDAMTAGKTDSTLIVAGLRSEQRE